MTKVIAQIHEFSGYHSRNFAVCTLALPWSSMKNKLSVILVHRNDAISQ